MRVKNIWDLRVPVIIEYQGKKITIPYDGMIYFLPDELRGHKFKGLLEVIPDDVPLTKHSPKLFNLKQNAKGQMYIAVDKPKPLEAFPNDIYRPELVVEPDYSMPVTPNTESFITYVKDIDDPTVLVDSLTVPTIAERRDEVEKGEKPLKKVRVDAKVREAKKKERREKYQKQSLKI